MDDLRKLKKKEKNLEKLPDSYNFLEIYPYCQIPIYNQNNSSTCYAFSTATTISYRLCKERKEYFQLNPYELINCDHFSSDSSSGGHEYLSWRYIQYKGLYNFSCNNVSSKEVCNPTNCPKYFAKCHSQIALHDEYSIKKELYENGPMTCLFKLMSDFSDYNNGIYESPNDDLYTGAFHVSTIIGWGVDENKNSYWILQNSYGDQWGQKGFFKMKRGINHLKIEDYCTSAAPL